MNKILLLSYPRSGSNWIAYIIQAGMGIEVVGTSGIVAGKREQMQVKCKPADAKYNTDCVVHKTHGHLNDLDTDGYDALIFCLRDYRKCIVNHCRSVDLEKLKQQACGLSAAENGSNPDYLYLLNYYDKWDKRKSFISYEQLTKNPQKIALYLRYFFSKYHCTDGEKFDYFYKDIELHYHTALKQYKQQDHPDYSECHKEFNLDEGAGLQFASYIKHTAGDELFDKYLKTYERKFTYYSHY